MPFVQTVMRLGSPIILIYAGLVVCWPWVSSVTAQVRRLDPPLVTYEGQVTREGVAIRYLEDRIKNLEAIGVERRLTILETLEKEVEANGFWSKLSSSAAGLVLVERGYIHVSRRRRKKSTDRSQDDELEDS